MISKLLQEHPWLRVASEGEIAKLAEATQERRFEAMEYLLRIYSTTDFLIFIESGFVASTAIDQYGRGYISNWLGSGNFINLIPVLDRKPAFYDYVAKTKVTTYAIDGKAIRSLIETNLKVSHQLIQFLCNRARKFQSDIYDFTFSSQLNRCARVFLNLADFHGTLTPSGTVLNLTITQAELGEMLGCTRQSVNMELSRLEEMGAIAMPARARYVILDMERLRSLARVDPDTSDTSLMPSTTRQYSGRSEAHSFPN